MTKKDRYRYVTVIFNNFYHDCFVLLVYDHRYSSLSLTAVILCYIVVTVILVDILKIINNNILKIMAIILTALTYTLIVLLLF